MMPPRARAVEANWLPDDEDVARYEADGFIVSPPILDPALLDRAWRAVSAFLDSDRSAISPAARVSDLRRRAGDALDHVGYLFHELAEIRSLIVGTAIAPAAARLSRALSIRLFHDRLLVKPPGGSANAAIGWHVDRAYWFGCTSESMLTAWIPFADVNAAMGPLIVLPGSHRWDDTPLMATAHRTDMDTLLEQAAQGRTAVGHPLAIRRGQVSFHHCRIVHGSLPNCGTGDRAALAVHLQPGDNRWRQVILPNGRTLGHTNDLLCRSDADGQPDYTDPDMFPLLWSATA